MKRPIIISIIAARLLALLLLLGLPAGALAQFDYATNIGAITITGYTGPGGVVAIPGTITGLPVTSIGSWAFYSNSMSSLTIPDTVTNIGNGAFFDCESLTNATIGDSVTVLGEWSFAFCSSQTAVNFRGNAPSLGGDHVFYGDLPTVYYLPETTGWGDTFATLPAVLWNPPVPFNYTTNEDTITITRYLGSGGPVAIPSTINFLPVTAIGEIAFYDAALSSVTIPGSVTNIGVGAFEACSNLANVTIPNGVISIGTSAFEDCASLTSADIPNSVTSIGLEAFFDCESLTNITISDGVTYLPEEAFGNCTSLTSITIPNSVTVIGGDGTAGGPFAECFGLTNVTIGKSVTVIGWAAFYYCTNLASIAIPNSVTNIEPEAFAYCTGLTSITIPNSVVSIQIDAFQGCAKLTNVTIPDSVTNLETWAFLDCTNLAGVYFQGNAPALTEGDGQFQNDNLATAYYLAGTTGWTNTYGGLPTVLWNPQAQAGGPSFGVRNGQFGFTITATTSIPIVVEACANLANPVWQPLQTCTVTNGSIYFSDPAWTNYPGRFYRITPP